MCFSKDNIEIYYSIYGFFSHEKPTIRWINETFQMYRSLKIERLIFKELISSSYISITSRNNKVLIPDGNPDQIAH